LGIRISVKLIIVSDNASAGAGFNIVILLNDFAILKAYSVTLTGVSCCARIISQFLIESIFLSIYSLSMLKFAPGTTMILF
jgi:hypothetical protein